MRWQDKVSGEEIAKRCGLKEVTESKTEKFAMVVTCEKRQRVEC